MRVVILYNHDDRLECGEYGPERADESLEEELRVVEDSLGKLGYEYRTIAISHSTPILSIANLVAGLNPDCVFNLVEAVKKNYLLEMAVPAMFDLLQIPYTGSGALALGLCQNKARAKDVMIANGVRTPPYYITSDPFLTHIWNRWPAIVKPSHEDGSLGITKDSVVYCSEDLNRVVKNIETTYRQPAIVEEFIDGREFGIGIIESGGVPTPFPVSEILFDGFPDGPRIVSYAAKWDGGSVEYNGSKPHCPADIEPDLATRLQHTAVGVFKLFGCRGYARIDTRVDADGMIYVLDVNPNPDIAPGSGVETVLKAAGVSYEEFVKNLIEGALRGR